MIHRAVSHVIALYSSLVLLIVGNAMLGTIVALRLEIVGFYPAMSGTVLAMYPVGFVLGCLHGTKVVVRVGHIRAFAAFGALAAAAVLAHTLHVSVAGWMALRLVQGFCIAGLMLVTESWINAHATEQTRGTLLSLYMVLLLLAAASGQFLIALGDPALHHLFIVAAMLISLSLIPLSLTRSPSPELPASGRMDIGALWRLSRLGTGGAFISGVAMSAFLTVGPIYAHRMGLAIEQVATFMGIAMLAAVGFQWPAGYVSDFVRRHVVLVSVTAAAAAAALLTALTGGHSPVWLYGTAALFYGFCTCIYPLSLAVVHDRVPGIRAVPVGAGFLLTFGAGTIIGPVLGGAAVNVAGPAGLFIFIAVVLASLLPLAAWAPTVEDMPAVDEQAHCVGVAPVTTPVIMELDPRNEAFEESVTPSSGGTGP